MLQYNQGEAVESVKYKKSNNKTNVKDYLASKKKNLKQQQELSVSNKQDNN